MRGPATNVNRIASLLYQNRIGGSILFLLYGFGACFGHALYQEVYKESIAAELLQLGTFKGGLPLGQVLLSAALPTFLYVCCMMLCAYEKRAIPLWGLCQLFASLRIGMAFGMIVSMKLWWALPLEIVLLLAQASLSLLCLDCRSAMQADAYKTIDRFLLPATIYLMLVCAIQLLMAAMLSRALVH